MLISTLSLFIESLDLRTAQEYRGSEKQKAFTGNTHMFIVHPNNSALEWIAQSIWTEHFFCCHPWLLASLELLASLIVVIPVCWHSWLLASLIVVIPDFWHPWFLAFLIVGIPDCWHPWLLMLASLIVGISDCWHPWLLTSLIVGIPDCWHPWLLTSLIVSIADSWHPWLLASSLFFVVVNFLSVVGVPAFVVVPAISFLSAAATVHCCCPSCCWRS